VRREKVGAREVRREEGEGRREEWKIAIREVSGFPGGGV
jgi:hypothetical protein